MAEPNWQPAEAPPWAKQEPNWQPAEAPPWAKEEPKERGVIERAGSEMAETFKGAAKAAARPITPPPKEELKEYLGPSGMLRSLRETGETILSPITGTLGTLFSGAQSLGASGLAPAMVFDPTTGRRFQTSEEQYEAAKPWAGAALSVLGADIRPVPGAAKTVPAVPRPRSPEGQIRKLIEEETS